MATIFYLTAVSAAQPKLLPDDNRPGYTKKCVTGQATAPV